MAEPLLKLWIRFASGNLAPKLSLATYLALGLLLLSSHVFAFAGLTNTASDVLCSVLKFLLGPLAWALVFGAFAVGVGALAVGGRGALRIVILSLVAALVLVIGISWAKNQMNSATSGILQSGQKPCGIQ